MITIKEVERLVADAENGSTKDKIRAELIVVEASLAAKKDERKRLKTSLDENYTDTEAASFNSAMNKSTQDLLQAGYQANYEVATQKLEIQKVNLETYSKMHLDTLRRITALKTEIAGLILKSKDFPSDAPEDIITETKQKYEEQSLLEKNLERYSSGISRIVLDIAETNAEIRNLKVLMKQNSELKFSSKKPISSRKVVDEVALATLDAEIDALEKRKAILTTDPKSLGEKIKGLIEKEEEVPPKEMKTLRLLALGTSIEEPSEKKGLKQSISIPGPLTAAELKDAQTVNAAQILARTRSIEYTQAEIIRMTAAVTSHIVLLNKAKLLRETVEKAYNSEANLPKQTGLRKMLGNIDDLIKKIEVAIEKNTIELGTQLDYYRESLAALTEFYCKSGSLAIADFQMEMKKPTSAPEKSPFEDDLMEIAAQLPLLRNAYPEPIKEAKNLPTLPMSITEDLKGETYPTEAKPEEPEAVVIEDLPTPAADLSKLDPINETLREAVAQALKVEPIEEAVLAPDASPVVEEPVIEPPKMPEPLPVVAEAGKVPTAEVMNTVPMSVREYEQKAKLVEIPTYPAPKVEKSVRVNVPEINKLISRALEAIKKTLTKAEGMKRI